MNLAAIGEAAAATASDYKALVCIFLFGGNDYANTVTPYDQPSYDLYAGLRGTIAHHAAIRWPQTILFPNAGLPGGRQYALAPDLAPLIPVFDAGRLAVVLNVGTLIQPTSKTNYTNKSVPLPPKLFSHNDQQSFWQASNPEGATSGWGGRIGDLLQSGNGTATLTCINAVGQRRLPLGQDRGPIWRHHHRAGAAAQQRRHPVRLGHRHEHAARADDRSRARICSRTSMPGSPSARSISRPRSAPRLAPARTSPRRSRPAIRSPTSCASSPA